MTDIPEEISAALDRSAVAHHVSTWLTAVERQHQRTLQAHDANEDQLPEACLYAVALYNLRRAARMASRYDANATTHAIAAFDEAVPHAAEVRHILGAHFDKYERGEGDIQKADRRREQQKNQRRIARGQPALPETWRLSFWWGRAGGEAYEINVASRFTLDFSAATTAARSLAEAILAALA